jgi:adenylosuccinate lyase
MAYKSYLADTSWIKNLYTADSKEFARAHMKSISTVDSRHAIITKDLWEYFSEFALHKYRCKVEMMHFLNMSELQQFAEVPFFNEQEKIKIYKMLQDLNEEDIRKIVEYDHYGRNGISATEHDVKSVEYFLHEKLTEMNRSELKPFIHMYCTSEDINNISYACMLRDGFNLVMMPKLRWILSRFSELIDAHATSVMMSRTHGQSASPTTFGKEIAVFVSRIQHHLKRLDELTLNVKFNGAVWNYNSHVLAKPNVNRMEYSKNMADIFWFNVEYLTNQRGPMTEVVALFQIIQNINNILKDFCRDIWSYNKDGIVYHSKIAGEIWSSVMPQKVNPRFLEEAEWFLMQANKMFDVFIENNDVSRLQRDMSWHPHERNYGDAFGNTLIAWTNILESLSRIHFDQEVSLQELSLHPAIVTEWIQTTLRRGKLDSAYELLKDFCRGKKLDWDSIRNFIMILGTSKEDVESNDQYMTIVNWLEKDEMKKLLLEINIDNNVIEELFPLVDPVNFVWMAPQLAKKANNDLEEFMREFDNKVTLTTRSRIQWVFFDFDNTLQLWDKEELSERIWAIINDVNKLVHDSDKQLTADDKEVICRYSDYRDMKKYIVEKSWLTDQQIQDFNNKYSWSFDENFYLDNMSVELLDLLYNAKIPTAIISTRWNQSLNRVSKDTHKIDNKVALVLWRDDVKEKKPDPEWIIKALDKIGVVASENVYYIWDKFREDVKAAENANVSPIYLKRIEEEGIWDNESRGVPTMSNMQEIYKFFFQKLI